MKRPRSMSDIIEDLNKATIKKTGAERRLCFLHGFLAGLIVGLTTAALVVLF